MWDTVASGVQVGTPCPLGQHVLLSWLKSMGTGVEVLFRLCPAYVRQQKNSGRQLSLDHVGGVLTKINITADQA